MGGACQKNHLLKSADKLQQDTPLRLKESDKMETFLGILIPFLGTTLGAACVFFMKNRWVIWYSGLLPALLPE